MKKRFCLLLLTILGSLILTVSEAENLVKKLPDANSARFKEATIYEPFGNDQIRLSGNSTNYNHGLVKVFRNNSWGYVCDDDWDIKDANVACRQLGFNRGAEKFVSASWYGEAENGLYLMDDVKCNGDEKQLQKCSYNIHHNCDKNEAAGVICKLDTGCEDQWIPGPTGCYRLFDGSFSRYNAENKCKSMNGHLVKIETQEENNFLSSILRMWKETHYWLTDGIKEQNWIWKTDGKTISPSFWFPGWEAQSHFPKPSNNTLKNCLALANAFKYEDSKYLSEYFYWDDINCNTVGNFICETEKSKTPSAAAASIKVELVGGSSELSGRIEITRNRTRGTVCDDEFDDNDAKVICRMMGHSSGEVIPNIFGYGEGTIWLDELNCTGSEYDLEVCPNLSWEVHDCTHKEDVAVKCFKEANTTTSITPTSSTDQNEPMKCTVNQMHCDSSNKCIPLRWTCDGENDCPGGEDETNCEPMKCTVNQMHCDSSHCIPLLWRCDGENDCSGGEDETNCEPMKCTVNQMHCDSSNKCIPLPWKCDGENNCPGGEDETNCELMKCEVSEMHCDSSGRCISQAWRCDGENDCPGGEDETNCECQVNEMHCDSSGRCIPLRWRCDGENDCPGGEDETNCGEFT